MRLPRNLATNATREPTSTGGAVSHSTDAMFAYHRGAFAGSAAYPATSATGSGIIASVSTSTSAIPDILESAHGRVHPPHPPGANSRHDRPAALSERRQACRRRRSGAPHWRPPHGRNRDSGHNHLLVRLGPPGDRKRRRPTPYSASSLQLRGVAPAPV